jgi:hypothetical protein
MPPLQNFMDTIGGNLSLVNYTGIIALACSML